MKTLRDKVEELINYEKIEIKEIYCIYVYGSCLYNSLTEKSDLDLTIILENSNSEMKQVLMKGYEYSIHYLSIKGYKKKIEDYEVDILQSLWIPDELLFYPNFEFFNFRKEFKIDLEKLQRNTIQCLIGCRAKSKHNYSKDKKLSLKNLVHGLRYLLFASQILKKGCIYNYSEGNLYFKEIFELNFHFWKDYDDYYYPISDKLKEKLLNELEDERSKFKDLNMKEFIDKYDLYELKRLFSIDNQEMNDLIILERSELSQLKYHIVNENFPFILTKYKRNIIGCGIKIINPYDIHYNSLKDFEIYKYYLKDFHILYFHKEWNVYSKDEKRFWEYWNIMGYKFDHIDQFCYIFQFISNSLILSYKINLKDFTFELGCENFNCIEKLNFKDDIEMMDSLFNIQEHCGYLLKSSKNSYQLYLPPISQMKIKKEQLLCEHNIDQYLNVIKFHNKKDLDQLFQDDLYKLLSESFFRLCKKINEILTQIKEERDIFDQKWRIISKYLLEIFQSKQTSEKYFKLFNIKSLRIILDKLLGVNKKYFEIKIG